MVERHHRPPAWAIALVALALAGCGSTAASGSGNPTTTPSPTPKAADTGPPSNAKPVIQYGQFHSDSLNGTLHYSIALPPGYQSNGKHYPVVYFLHGLPANDQTYKNIGGYADSLDATNHPAIVVGAQGARDGDTDPEWRDWGAGRNWETATESELVKWIDGHYRTIPKRSGRAIIGVSAGGYGATLIAIHHPGTYQVIESWSGYFVATDPDGKPLDLGSPEANAHANAHASVPTLKDDFSPYPSTFFAFYIGTKDPYPGFVDDNVKLSEELSDARIPHVFALYEGAHNGEFWNEHQDDWLAAAAARLDRPT
jgi:putative tributyrin esterase